jgi:hypothetical protein
VTTWEYAHERGRSTALRIGDWLRPRAKALGELMRRARKLALPVLGVGCFVAAAFTVSILAGLITAGVGFFFVEWRFAK